MADVSEPNFPADLIDAQRELLGVQAELHALQKRLAWSLEPAEAISSTDGWRRFKRPATGDWTEDEAASYDRLRLRARDLATTIICHTHWSQFDGAEVTKMRSLLKKLPTVQPVIPVAGGTTDDVTAAA
ncbi:hypothetical protein [Streptomyces sp. NPDC046939]|uniref:hypothetical protein n=1 Tax=Streptomyces sp. NPDC046939 TaxID=3155376 RepID=UPI0033CF51A1